MDSPTPKKKSNWLAWALVIALGAGLALSLMLNAGLAASLFAHKAHLSLDDEGGGTDEFPSFEEIWSYGSGEVKAARIAVMGPILREVEGGLFGPGVDKIESILAQIRMARNDEEVKAIILEVESPGGGITESDEIYAALQDFRATDDERIVLVFIRDLAASGGYYIAMAGDWLMAEPTAVVGSIGVIMQTLNWKTLSEKIGIKDTTIKSGANKDLLNPFADTPPEQMALLQGMIDSMYEHFLGIVIEGRGIEDAVMRPLADGRIFVARQARELNLIDDIGYWDDAVDKTAELLGEETVKVVRYQQPVTFSDILASLHSTVKFSAAQATGRPRFMYLWKP